VIGGGPCGLYHGSGASGVRHKQPELAGSDRRPQKVTILEKSKRVVWRDPSGPGSCEGGIFTAARNKVSHFNDSQQTSCAAWGK